MAVLRTLPGRIKTLNTRRINVLRGEQRRVSGSARVSLKRRIWRRDAGHCCLCRRVVDLCDSELDHRIALQFGGGNEGGDHPAKKNDRPGHRAPSHAEKKFPFQGS
ncbi:HNH endonuclease [Escherichia coli O157:H7]|uniref:HNH endonuclease n=1 Tax=Escherichia coli TaxID=562 RepID=UPI0015C5CB3C|nr:HNH endonuclease [Escherichia coli]NYB00221.1 HNH endonuclease [Escherichia coli O157:H7]